MQAFHAAAALLERLRRRLHVDQAAAGGHPLNAAGFDDAFVAAGIAMGDVAVENERHGFEAAMGMRAEGQAVVGRAVVLRSVVIQEQERIDVVDGSGGHGAARHQIGDVFAHGVVDAAYGSKGHTFQITRSRAQPRQSVVTWRRRELGDRNNDGNAGFIPPDLESRDHVILDLCVAPAGIQMQQATLALISQGATSAGINNWYWRVVVSK